MTRSDEPETFECLRQHRNGMTKHVRLRAEEIVAMRRHEGGSVHARHGMTSRLVVCERLVDRRREKLLVPVSVWNRVKGAVP